MPSQRERNLSFSQSLALTALMILMGHFHLPRGQHVLQPVTTSWSAPLRLFSAVGPLNYLLALTLINIWYHLFSKSKLSGGKLPAMELVGCRLLAWIHLPVGVGVGGFNIDLHLCTYPWFSFVKETPGNDTVVAGRWSRAKVACSQIIYCWVKSSEVFCAAVFIFLY